MYYQIQTNTITPAMPITMLSYPRRYTGWCSYRGRRPKSIRNKLPPSHPSQCPQNRASVKSHLS